MRTITIKLPEDESLELDEFIKKKGYPSRSEYIRQLILNSMDKTRQEKIGWMITAEDSMRKIWDNEKDENIWQEYL